MTSESNWTFASYRTYNNKTSKSTTTTAITKYEMCRFSVLWNRSTIQVSDNTRAMGLVSTLELNNVYLHSHPLVESAFGANILKSSKDTDSRIYFSVCMYLTELHSVWPFQNSLYKWTAHSLRQQQRQNKIELHDRERGRDAKKLRRRWRRKTAIRTEE